MNKKNCLKKFLQGAGIGFFLLAFWVAITKTPLDLQAGTINPVDDGPGGCCDPANPYDPVGGCRSWEECKIANGACSTNKSCCAKNNEGCSQNSDCCSGHCCSGTCRDKCESPTQGQLSCGANGSGVWIVNTGGETMNGVSFDWFASYCKGTSCFCSGGPHHETVNLSPGQKISRGFTNKHPPCEWSWQTDVTASWGNQTCHRSAHGCDSEPCITPTPKPTSTPTPKPTPTPTTTPIPTPTPTPSLTPSPTPTPTPTPTLTPTPTITLTPSPTLTQTPTPTSTPTPTKTPTPTPTATPTPTPSPEPTATSTPESTPSPTPTPPQVLGAQAPPVLPKAGFSSSLFFFLASVGVIFHFLALLL